MDFGDAIRSMKAGKRVSRAGWNGKGMWLRLAGPYIVDQLPGDLETALKTSLLFIEMRTADVQFVPWLASQTDMLAEDWAEVAA